MFYLLFLSYIVETCSKIVFSNLFSNSVFSLFCRVLCPFHICFYFPIFSAGLLKVFRAQHLSTTSVACVAFMVQFRAAVFCPDFVCQFGGFILIESHDLHCWRFVKVFLNAFPRCRVTRFDGLHLHLVRFPRCTKHFSISVAIVASSCFTPTLRNHRLPVHHLGANSVLHSPVGAPNRTSARACGVPLMSFPIPTTADCDSWGMPVTRAFVVSSSVPFISHQTFIFAFF